MPKSYTSSDPEVIETPFTRITLRCHYPVENPPGMVEEVTDALHYLGLIGQKNAGTKPFDDKHKED